MKSVHCLLSPEDLENLTHTEFVKKLKAQGFRFDSEDCPVKVTRPCQQTQLPDGSVMWQQDQETLLQ